MADKQTPVGTNSTISEPISADGTPVLGTTYEVPARRGRAVRLKAAQTIRITNTHGKQVCDTWVFNAEDRSEFLSNEHARAWIDRIIPKAGDPLVSNHRRPIATLMVDTSPGIHDTLMAACDAYRYTTLGVKEYHDNCNDNLLLAMAAIGAPINEVPSPFNLWMNIPVGPDNGIQWLAPVSSAGDYVELRAEMDVIVAMSACPQDIIPINDLKPVECHFEVF